MIAGAPVRAALAGAAALATLVLATIALAPWAAEAHRGSDFPQFWLAPRELLAGGDPYAPPWGFPYPLWTMLVLLPLAPLSFGHAAAAWILFQLAAAAIALGALLRALGAGRREAVLLFGIAAAAQPTWLLVAGGNMTGLLTALFAGALAAHVAGRPLLAGALAGVLIVKPHPFLVSGPVLAMATRWRARIVAGALLTAGGLVTASVLVRPGWWDDWTRAAFTLQTSVGSNATLWTIDRAAGGGVIAVALTVGLVVAAFAAWWWRARPDLPALVAGALPVSLVVAPHGWSYDHLLLLVSAAVILALLARAPAGPRIAGTTALLTVLGPMAWVLYAVAFGRGGEELAPAIPLLVLALVVYAHRTSGTSVPFSR